MSADDHMIHTKRDQIASILTRHINFPDSLERANNITQALVFGENPDQTVRDMLSAYKISGLETVIKDIEEAWQA